MLCPAEQHAVQELTKAAMNGLDIDHEVLTYLELAQVSIMTVVPSGTVHITV